MNSKSSQNGHPASPPKINKDLLISGIIRNWYLFIAAAIFGLIAAFIYNQYFPKNYKASSVFLLKNQPHQLVMETPMEDLNIRERSPKVQNELAVLSSYQLQVKTLQNLNWVVSWTKNSLFTKEDLYREEPFLVTSSQISGQQKEIPLTIKVISDSVYSVSCSFHGPGSSKRNIEFKERGSFGRPFQNQYFNFTLNKIEDRLPLVGAEYKLQFNDLNQMAIDYQSRLEVKTTATESDIITVDLKGTNAQRVVDYLNALGTSYVEFGLEEKNRIAGNKLTFIRTQITGLSDSLKTSGNRFTSFRSKNRIVDLSQEGTQTLKKVEDVAVQENLLRARIDYYSSLKANLTEGGQIKNIASPVEAGLTDPTIINLLLKLNDLISRREALANMVQPGNPKMIAANKEIEFTQKQIAGNVNSLLINAQNELQKLEIQKQQVNAQLSDIPKTERTLLGFKRDFDINSQLYNYLLQKSAEAAIALASNDPDVQILDKAAIENTERVGFKPYINLLIGFSIALILALTTVALREFSSSRLKNANYVAGVLDLSVAGLISHNTSGTEIPVLQRPYSEITESFRNLRATLQYLLKESGGNVIAIHSTVRGEGKSFVAVNLASIISLSNKNVLLIEADFRNPHLYRTLGVNNENGLSDYLAKTSSFDGIQKRSRIEGLTFISAGTNNPRLSEMLTTHQLAQLIDEAKKKYDIILIDNAPFKIVSDSKIFASQADINLFVLKMDYSTEEELAYINKTAREEMTKNMVVVLNDVSERKRNGSRGRVILMMKNFRSTPAT